MRRSHLSLLALAAAAPAFAQAPRPTVADSPATRIMARIGTRADATALRDVLRQTSVLWSRVTLDEIADSLVARATDPRAAAQASDAYANASGAVKTLILAGSRGDAGHPYAGAVDRLIAIHRRASVRDVRVHALAGMLGAPFSRAQAIAYLSDVAESNDSTAYDAVEFLITDASGGSWIGVQPTRAARQQSAAALKTLGMSGRIANPAAARLLSFWTDGHR